MIIHRAFIREVLQTAGAVIVIILSIFLATRAVYFLRQAAEGDIPIGGVTLLVLLKTITYLDIMVPLVVYIAMLMVLGRWVRDNELTVISACGISMGRFIRPTFMLFLGVGSVVALLSLYLSPMSVEISHRKEREYRNRTDVAGLLPGVFTETRSGRGVIFVERYDRDTDTFHDVFVYNGNGEEESVVVAGVGERSFDEAAGSDFLVLKEGTQYRGAIGAAEYGVLDFESYGLRLDRKPGADPALPPKARATRDLLAGDDAATAGQFHWRLSKVAMLPVLMLFALAFSSIHSRGTRFPGMLMALLVYFGYFNSLGFAAALVNRGAAGPYSTLWAIHAGFLALALYLFHRRNRNLPLVPWPANQRPKA